jgi:hypothetical protein
VLSRLNCCVRRHERQKRLALHGIGNRNMRSLQDGGRNIHETDKGFDLSRGVLSRKLDQQRNVDGFVVKKNAVMRFAVFSEGLAMVRHDGNHGAVEKAPGPQFADQFSDDGIGVCNFPVVGLCPIARSIWLRRVVRIMWIVKMHPQKEGASGVLCSAMRLPDQQPLRRGAPGYGSCLPRGVEGAVRGFYFESARDFETKLRS